MGLIRDSFTDSEIINAVREADNNLTRAARILSRMKGIVVSRQLLQYWLSVLDFKDVNEAIDSTRELAKARALTVQNAALRREAKRLADKVNILTDFTEAIGTININVSPPELAPPFTFDQEKPTAELEVLFSDLQIGKLTANYNSDIANARVVEFTAQVQQYFYDMSASYNIKKITVALLGDIIESDKKHKDSARACDIGTAEQMQIATEAISNMLLIIGRLVPTDVVCVTGNHDHDGHGLSPYMSGQEHLSWSMYNAIKLICNSSGININFIIPRGCFYVHQILNSTVLYEHGVGISCTEPSMSARANQRGHQVNRLINLFRMGDKHNICRLNNDKYVVNGAFFGGDSIGSEYSSALGYHSQPAQIMFLHIDKPVNQVVESKVIYFD